MSERYLNNIPTRIDVPLYAQASRITRFAMETKDLVELKVGAQVTYTVTQIDREVSDRL